LTGLHLVTKIGDSNGTIAVNCTTILTELRSTKRQEIYFCWCSNCKQSKKHTLNTN